MYLWSKTKSLKLFTNFSAVIPPDKIDEMYPKSKLVLCMT